MPTNKTSSGKFATRPPAASNNLAALPSGERKAHLFLQHPEESPELIGTLPFLIHPPSKLSSNASWIFFRDKTLMPLMRQRPEDPNLPNFLKQVDAILVWRAAVPPADRFWREDEPPHSPH